MCSSTSGLPWRCSPSAAASFHAPTQREKGLATQAGVCVPVGVSWRTAGSRRSEKSLWWQIFLIDWQLEGDDGQIRCGFHWRWRTSGDGSKELSSKKIKSLLDTKSLFGVRLTKWSYRERTSEIEWIPDHNPVHPQPAVNQSFDWLNNNQLLCESKKKKSYSFR